VVAVIHGALQPSQLSEAKEKQRESQASYPKQKKNREKETLGTEKRCLCDRMSTLKDFYGSIRFREFF